MVTTGTAGHGRHRRQAPSPEPTASTGADVQRGNLPSLTGLRWFAALAVLGVHVGFTGPPSLVDLAQTGAIGVSFFFILSGFVLTWSASIRDTPGRFYGRRLARIYPVYLVTWILGAVLIAWDHSAGGVRSFLLGVPLLQAWSPATEDHFGINTPAWSLSAEAFFYLLFPLLWRRLRVLSTRALVGVAAGTFAAITIADLAAIATTSAQDLNNTRTTLAWFVYVFPPVRFLEFVVGCVAALLLQRGVRVTVPVWLAVTITVVAYVALTMGPDAHAGTFITLIPFTLLITSLAKRDNAGGSTPFAWGWLVLLGQWSFAFYLVHFEVLRIVPQLKERGWIPRPLTGAGGGILLRIVLALGGAALLHYLVERPLERRIRRRLSPSRPLPVSG